MLFYMLFYSMCMFLDLCDYLMNPSAALTVASVGEDSDVEIMGWKENEHVHLPGNSPKLASTDASSNANALIHYHKRKMDFAAVPKPALPKFKLRTTNKLRTTKRHKIVVHPDHLSKMNNDVLGKIVSFVFHRRQDSIVPPCAAMCSVSKDFRDRFWYFTGQHDISLPIGVSCPDDLLCPIDTRRITTDHFRATVKALTIENNRWGLQPYHILILFKMPQLQYLDIKCFTHGHLHVLTSVTSLVLGETGQVNLPPNLQSLHLTEQNEWHDVDVSKLTKLRRLQIESGTLQTLKGLPDNLENLAVRCTMLEKPIVYPRGLKSLTLHDWDYNEIDGIAQLPELSEVILNRLYFLITGEPACSMTACSMIANLATCPNLTRLTMTSVASCFQVLASLASRLEYLTIFLDEFQEITWQGIDAFVRLKELRVVGGGDMYDGPNQRLCSEAWCMDLLSAPHVSVLCKLPVLETIVLFGCMGQTACFDDVCRPCTVSPTCTCPPQPKKDPLDFDSDSDDDYLINCVTAYEETRCNRKKCACHVLAGHFPHFRRNLARQRAGFSKRPLHGADLLR